MGTGELLRKGAGWFGDPEIMIALAD